MLPMRSIVVSKSKPWNMPSWKCSRLRRVVQQRSGCCSRRYSPAATRKPARAAGRIADLVGRRRRGHLDHQLDDVARRAELAVLPGRGDLGEHVLVEVALGVAVVHRDVVEHVDDLRQQRRRRDREPGVLHVVRRRSSRRRRSEIVRRNGKTCSPTTVNMSAGARFLKRDQRRSS